MWWIVIVPSHEPGGPLRVVATRPPGHAPRPCLSARLPPRLYDEAEARRVAGACRRDRGRPIAIPVSEWWGRGE